MGTTATLIITALLLLLSASFADTFLTTSSLYNGRPNITTDITTTPSIGTSGAIFCTDTAGHPNSQISFITGLQSSWRNGGLTGASLVSSLSCPSSPTATTGHALAFISSTNYQNYIIDPNQGNRIFNWNTFQQAINNAATLYPEAVEYIDTVPLQTCRVDVAALCTASMYLMEYDSQNNVLREESLGAYIGNGNGVPVPSFSRSAGTQPLVRNFKLKLVKSCSTVVNNSGNTYNINKNGHNNMASLSQQISVPVQDPFTCVALPISNAVSNSPVPPASLAQVNFTLTNNVGRAINITSISLASSSPFTNLAILSPALPQTIANGQQMPVRISVSVPQAAGTYPLNLSIRYVTAAPDCTGSTITCTPGGAAGVFIVNITVQPTGNRCVLSHSSSSNNFNPGDSTQFNATCFDRNNARIGCPTLQWGTDITGGEMQPASTSASSAPISTLSISSAAPVVQRNKQVFAGNALENMACNYPNLTVGQITDCTIYPRLQNITSGRQYVFNSTCNSSRLQVPCPSLLWSSDAGSMSPSSHPLSSTLTVNNANGTYVGASGLQSGGDPITCNSSTLGAGNYNLVAKITSDKKNPRTGESFNLIVSVRAGSQVLLPFNNTLNETSPVQLLQSFMLNGLVGETTRTYPFTCPSTVSVMRFVFTADSSDSIQETNENDNTVELSVPCGLATRLTCKDFI